MPHAIKILLVLIITLVVPSKSNDTITTASYGPPISIPVHSDSLSSIFSFHQLMVENAPKQVIQAPVVQPAQPVIHELPKEASVTVWDKLAECESSGNWADTAGQFEGGLQFLNSTWLQYGGGSYAHHAYDATREQQIEIAEKALAGRPDWSAWPACSKKLGLR